MKTRLLLLLIVSAALANFPFLGTVENSDGFPIEGATVTAFHNKITTKTDSVGMFGGVSEKVTVKDAIHPGSANLSQPVLRRNALFYSAAKRGETVSLKMYDLRGRMVLQKRGISTAQGVNSLSMESGSSLGKALYILSLQVGNKLYTFKSVTSDLDNYTALPETHTGAVSMRADEENATVQLNDTLWFRAPGYKTTAFPVSDTGYIGTIILESADSEEVAFKWIELAWDFKSQLNFRGDSVNLSMRLTNLGTINALSVSCTLSTDDPYVTIVKSISNYNNIVVGTSVKGFSDYKLLIPRDLPRGHTIAFKLGIEDSWGNSWQDVALYQPYPFELTHQRIDDDTYGASSGNDNSIADNGEDVEYTPVILAVDRDTTRADSALFVTAGAVDAQPQCVSFTTVENLSGLIVNRDFNLSRSGTGTVGDLIVKAGSQYYLLPIDLGDESIPETPSLNANISVDDLVLEYTSEANYYPLDRRDTVLLRTTLKNTGTEAAYSVACSMAVSDTRITVVTPMIDYDNIDAGETVLPVNYWSRDSIGDWHAPGSKNNPSDTEYRFNPVHKVRIPRDFPAGESIEFVLHIKDSWGATWSDTVSYMPYPFKVTQELVDDDNIPSSNGNDDGILQVGETIEYTPRVKNLSGAAISDISGTFMTNSSFDLMDSIWDYNDLAAEAVGQPSLDYVFKVENNLTNYGGIFEADIMVSATVHGEKKEFLLPLDFTSGTYGVPEITELSAPDTVQLDSLLTITVTANDSNGTVEKFVWSLDGEPYRDTTTSGTFTQVFNTEGYRTVRVKAIDDDGRESDPVSARVYAQSPYFIKSYEIPGSYSNDVEGRSVALTSDGGAYITGEKKVSGDYSPIVKRVDRWGKTLWIKTVGGGTAERGTSVAVTSDGGAIITGYAYSQSEDYNLFVCRIDSNGNTLWTQTYASAYADKGFSVAVTDDDGALITGVANRSYLLLMRVDSNGEILWNKTYTELSYGHGLSIAATSDGGALVTGEKYTNSSGYYKDLWLLRFNSSGDVLWSKTYGGPGDEVGNSVVVTSDGGALVTGYTESFAVGSSDLWLLRTDSNGDTLWAKNYGGIGVNRGYSLALANDGGAYITGVTKESDISDFDVWLLRTESNGDTLWTKTYDSGIGTFDAGYSLAVTNNNDVFITGQYLYYDLLYMKVDENGEIR